MSTMETSDYTFGGWWITLTLSLGVFALLMTLVVKRAKFLYSLRNVPSPIALPIIGNACQLNCSLEEFFRRLVIWSREFGDIYLIWLGTRPLVFVYRAEAVQPLLSSSVHIDKSLEYQYLKPWLGTGLVTGTGDKWHFRRKLLTPTFHNGVVDGYLKSTIHQAAVMVSCLEKEIGKPGFDIVPYAKRAALDMICVTTMGYNVNAQVNSNNEYVVAVEKMTSIIQTRFTNIWLSLDPIFRRTSMGRVHDQSLDVIHRFVDTVIRNRKAEWQSKSDADLNDKSRSDADSNDKSKGDANLNEKLKSDADLNDKSKSDADLNEKLKSDDDSNDKSKSDADLNEKLKSDADSNDKSSSKKRLPLLDTLLRVSENGRVLTDEDIKEEVNTFLFAGHDTVATSVSWILYTLGAHPEYQTKIVDEYNELIGNNEITLESLNKLVWLDACVKETWRLYPVVPLLARQIYQPIKLMDNEVPVGSTVLVNTFLLHRDPRYFPQPEVYRPERFLPDSPKFPPFSYIPFSAGSRNCIGMKFAIMETKVTILSIVRSFVIQSLQPADKLQLISSIVLISAHGINLTVSPRQ